MGPSLTQMYAPPSNPQSGAPPGIRPPAVQQQYQYNRDLYAPPPVHHSQQQMDGIVGNHMPYSLFFSLFGCFSNMYLMFAKCVLYSIPAGYGFSLSKPLDQWSKQEVFAWVNSSEPIVAELGRQLYDNDVDGSVLAQLDDNDLQGLGVTSLGKRKKLLTAIALIKLNQNPAGMSPALRQDGFSLW